MTLCKLLAGDTWRPTVGFAPLGLPTWLCSRAWQSTADDEFVAAGGDGVWLHYLVREGGQRSRQYGQTGESWTTARRSVRAIQKQKACNSRTS